MKQYDFDEVIDRKGTDCVKADRLEADFGAAGLTPLWVADMDFRSPDFIVDAIRKRCAHEVFGYTFASDAYYDCIINWVKQRYGWDTEREWISYIPGIVKGIAFVIDCFTRPGDKVIIQPPVYHPFRIVPESMGRRVLYNPLKLVNGAYAMDFEQLEAVIDDGCKLLILCNPHNPGGIVWPKDTLIRLAGICAKRRILVVSDEIHAEMVYPGYRHYPFPSLLGADFPCITFMAPSKTFNIAGIVASYAVIPHAATRRQFFSFLKARELNDGSIFAYQATMAAYTHGNEWRRQMLAYVIGNVDFVADFTGRRLPQIKVYRPQASFLIWLDCKGLHVTQPELVSLFLKAGLALNDGAMFGPGGEGYMRLNAGCPRCVTEQALNALKTTLDEK
ncbi:MAG: PatB family C-S lyase [Tannerellaceae bacterium]|jgi:cystathionine beta-lyase|nr:PatB family C-S lyase [Tannerellaceae bacterium]